MEQKIPDQEEPKKNNSYVNGLLYQRRVQLNTEAAAKRRKQNAIFQRHKKKNQEEQKELVEKMSKADQKKIDFYNKVFEGVRTNDKGKKRRERRGRGRRENIQGKGIKKGFEGNRNQKNRQRNQRNNKNQVDGDPRALAYAKRKNRFKNFNKRNKKGQPIMKYRVNDLLKKVKKQVRGDSRPNDS